MTKTTISNDPLLCCLRYVMEKAHLSCTETSLVAGLPLVNGCLTPELVVRSSESAGLPAKISKRGVRDIPPALCPVILFQHNNRCVVLNNLDLQNDLAAIYNPETGADDSISVAALDELYAGRCVIFAKESASVTTSSPAAELVSSEWFWSTLKRSWKIYRDVLLASAFINVFALAMPLFVMNVYDRVVPNNALETLWVLAIGVILVAGFDFTLRTLRAYFIEVAGKKSDILLSSFIFSKVLGAKFSEHPKSSGVFANQLREFESVRGFITSAVVTSLVDLPFSVFFYIIIAYVGGVLVWVPLVSAPLILGYSWWVQHHLQASVEQSLSASAQKNATLVEAVVGLETLKTLGAEGRVQKQWESAVGQLAAWGIKARLYSNSASLIAMLLIQLTSVGIVVAGVYAIEARELTMGALVAVVLLVGRALAPMAQVANLLVQFQQAKQAFGALHMIVGKAQERPPHRKFIQRSSLAGNIAFNDVSFGYPGEKTAVLAKVSFSIAAREKVAIIGRLGSGKSTIHRLIMGLYEPASGSVLLDGVDIAQIDPADIRGNMGYVPQDSMLFSGTVRENIGYRHYWVDDEEIKRVADESGVSLFTDTHPLGLERHVGERGEALSGGQRQAVCLARALVNRPPILLLDEPTSAMDNASEAVVLANLEKHIQDQTVLLVTHKTSLLKLVDRVIVLNAGKIIADGSRDFIVEALKNGQLRVS